MAIFSRPLCRRTAKRSHGKPGKESIPMRVLFIGNSHTFYNDMPAVFAGLAREAGVFCEVTMIAHGGWFLEQHQAEPETRFNIRHGSYDYVVLQEHAHPFGPEEKMQNAAKALCTWIREAGSTPVAYMTWARKGMEEEQSAMTAAYRRMAEEQQALLAPVGEKWWEYIHANPDIEMYNEDGAHASEAGSAFAAKVLWETIRQHAGC